MMGSKYPLWADVQGSYEVWCVKMSLADGQRVTHGQTAACLGSSQEEQNCEVMANAAREYKQMPDSMAPGIPMVKDIEHNAYGVENSTCQQPAKALRR